MKKLFIISVSLIFISGFVFSQDSTEKKKFLNSFKFSITNFVDNTFQVSYERKIHKNSGLLISTGISYKHNSNDNIEGYKGEVQYKYFVYTKEKENSSKSIYFAPYFFYKYTERKSNNYLYQYVYDPEKYFFNSFSGGVLFGTNFIIAKRISIDLYIGGGIKRSLGAHLKDNIYYYNNDIWEPGYSGIIPKIGMDAGFKF